jgi:hypothetical protein
MPTDPTPERPESLTFDRNAPDIMAEEAIATVQACLPFGTNHPGDECSRMVLSIILRAREQGRKEERERCLAIIRNPYGDAVACFGSDEPFTVSRKMALALVAKAPEKG